MFKISILLKNYQGVAQLAEHSVWGGEVYQIVAGHPDQISIRLGWGGLKEEK